MKINNKFLLAVWLLIFLSACQIKPKIINHTPPDLVVSFEAFNDPSLASRFGCNELQMPSNLLGGLEPPYPIAICTIQYIPGEGSEELIAAIDNGQYLYYTGGLFGTYIRYVIQQDGEFVLLKTEKDFRKVFAPIESADEALSYALAVRNLSAYYGIEYFPEYEYEVDTIEDTFVAPEADGYLVHLFYDSVFGCGPHWTFAVDVHVSTDGSMEELSSTPLFRDPNLDELCVD